MLISRFIMELRFVFEGSLQDRTTASQSSGSGSTIVFNSGGESGVAESGGD